MVIYLPNSLPVNISNIEVEPNEYRPETCMHIQSHGYLLQDLYTAKTTIQGLCVKSTKMTLAPRISVCKSYLQTLHVIPAEESLLLGYWGVFL